MGISVKNLRKCYGSQAVLRDLTLTLGEGVTCLVAPSGAGKTTLLRILMGLEQPDSGTVEGMAGRRIAAVFQEDRLLEALDALDNLRFVLGSAMDAAAAEMLLRALGLEGLRGKCVREFSGGMRRRLCLARALLAPSDTLFLDEPFTGLDQENRKHCLDVLRQYGAGKTVVLVSHDLSDAEALGAQVVMLP